MDTPDIIPQEKKSIGKTVAIILGILAIVIVLPIAILLTGIFTSNQKSTDVAKEFFQLNADGDYGGAYELAHSEFKEIVNADGLEAFVVNYPVMDDMTEIDFSYSSTDGDLQLLSGTIKGAGEESPITVQLLEEEGEWKIVFFSLNAEDVPNSD
ncbi:hypothetical protein KJ766_03070 [Patescibacteria group bacterium]|nr:hypothetical protein [Patescibacteria group bacterium]